MIIIHTLLIIANVYYLRAQPENNTTICPLQDPAVMNFRKYLEIDTSRSENLYKAVDFLRSLSSEIGLDFAVYTPAGIPICVLTWPGVDPSLPSIMLNSHMDVVEADEARWKYPPFAAHVDENCNVYARGAQDTKDVGILYIEAIRRLKKQNAALNRTIHITFMPAMNFTVMGTGGHGFLMPGDVAVEKLQRLLDVMLNYRKSLREAVASEEPTNYGPYTSLNINIINVNSWAEYAGEGTKLEFLRQEMESSATSVDDNNPYWVTLKNTINELGVKLVPIICPATSDMLFVRNYGIPALGFVPVFRTTQKLHQDNEYINLGIFLHGIDIYEAVIRNLGNLPRIL
ncbi:unnamed protein product [Diatraea saccharalis]|uniref:N-acyl-L-amino-acid amidohydrolase n=1 Tax=Diatraea saccharalis TaxID=40085 RepID=A0A9N9QXR7_9NEOP|nr:unnamed protein product [Diatraea saccharalis]